MGLITAVGTVLVFATLTAATTKVSRNTSTVRNDDYLDHDERGHPERDPSEVDPDDPCDLRNYKDIHIVNTLLVYAILAWLISIVYVQVSMFFRLYWTQYVRMAVSLIVLLLISIFVILFFAKYSSLCDKYTNIVVVGVLVGALMMITIALDVYLKDKREKREARRRRREAERGQGVEEQGNEGQTAETQRAEAPRAAAPGGPLRTFMSYFRK